MSAEIGTAGIIEVLRDGALEIEGRLTAASNATLLGRTSIEERQVRCVVKPVAGERPLWDFPEGTLAGRELAAFGLSEALGWDLVPTTVWRDDPLVGASMCQMWIEEEPDRSPVIVARPEELPTDWVVVLRGEDPQGGPLVLAHALREDLLRIAVFDVLANNADRKGGHVLADQRDRLWAIDHGVTFAVEDKLRTVLWGWAGVAVPDELAGDVQGVLNDGSALEQLVDPWLTESESIALRERMRAVAAGGRLPVPGGDRAMVPWPVL